MRALLIALLVLSPITLTLADDAVEKKGQVNYWLSKLADDDAQVQKQAAAELRKIGKEAVPALREAARDKSATDDLRARADAVLKGIEEDASAQADPKPVDVLPPPEESPLRPGARFRVPPPPRNFADARAQAEARARNFALPAAPGAAFARSFDRNFTTTANGRTISIRENNESITVTTTEDIQGRTVTRITQAKNAESLKRDHPEAFRVYEQYKTRLGPRLQRTVPPINIPPRALAPLDELDVPAPDREQIDKALADAMAQANRALANHRMLMEQHGRTIRDHQKMIEDLRHQALMELERQFRGEAEDR